jgi:hypothetical protein
MRRSSLRWTIPLFLGLQVALLWLHGAQIHRQNQVLLGLREDIQSLADAIESGNSAGDGGEESQAVPSSFQEPSGSTKDQKKMAVLGADEEQDAAAAKDLQASRDSAKKAISEARETQSKLSITENIKKAEEAKKVQVATNEWQRWVWGAMGLVALALVARSVLRRRG